jgi:hypothetical protein
MICRRASTKSMPNAVGGGGQCGSPDHEHPERQAELADPTYRARVERGLIITVNVFDWNCPQHIAPRYTAEEIAVAVEPLKARLAKLEAKLGASWRPSSASGAWSSRIGRRGRRQFRNAHAAGRPLREIQNELVFSDVPSADDLEGERVGAARRAGSRLIGDGDPRTSSDTLVVSFTLLHATPASPPAPRGPLLVPQIVEVPLRHADPKALAGRRRA